MEQFCITSPCTPSELVHFRRSIKKEELELILAESIRINEDSNDNSHHKSAFIDSTVQEKNITYPTDAKLHKKIVSKVLEIVKDLGLHLRQSYKFVLKSIFRDLCFKNHSKNRSKALKADRILRTIARSLRELKRNLEENYQYAELIALFEKVLAQKKQSKQKIYSS